MKKIIVDLIYKGLHIWRTFPDFYLTESRASNEDSTDHNKDKIRGHAVGNKKIVPW